MPLIRPFAGLRPVAGRAEDVVAPPYDVLNSTEARARAAGRPWSFLHISKAEIDLPEGTDPHADEVYARAAGNLQAMLQDGVMTENRLLMPGDIAHVASIEDRKVYVMGSVKQAGTLPIGRNGLSLTEAISNVGGLNEIEADATGIFVIRRLPEGNEKLARVYQLNLADATAMVLGVEFPLQENDVVYVTAAPISRWARVLNQIFPTILTIDIIDRIGTR